jgi:hypothetical protein
MLSRASGSKDHQSPSWTNAALSPPPIGSVAVSTVTPAVSVPFPSAVRPVALKNSACFIFGCRIAWARPVTGPAPPAPPLSV